VSESARRVVFNADDLGVSDANNAGVLAAAHTGIVREASLCVTAPAAERAARQVRQSGLDLGIGLHFSLTVGRALSGKLRGVTDARARFLSLPPVLLACAMQRIDRDAVEQELRAQLMAVRDFGLVVTHLNSHHHVHVYPVVRDAVLGVLEDYPELHVRVPLASKSAAFSPRTGLLGALSTSFVRRAHAQRRGLRWLPLVGLHLGRDHARGFERIARRLPSEPVEWVVHPRIGPFAPDGGGALGKPASDDELATLSSPRTRELLSELGIVPSAYREIARLPAGHGDRQGETHSMGSWTRRTRSRA
jgi:predicted glycoside hydrolase/deacetylase ChbG (UPF0249 family)